MIPRVALSRFNLIALRSPLFSSLFFLLSSTFVAHPSMINSFFCSTNSFAAPFYLQLGPPFSLFLLSSPGNITFYSLVAIERWTTAWNKVTKSMDGQRDTFFHRSRLFAFIARRRIKCWRWKEIQGIRIRYLILRQCLHLSMGHTVWSLGFGPASSH